MSVKAIRIGRVGSSVSRRPSKVRNDSHFGAVGGPWYEEDEAVKGRDLEVWRVIIGCAKISEGASTRPGIHEQ